MYPVNRQKHVEELRPSAEPLRAADPLAALADADLEPIPERITLPPSPFFRVCRREVLRHDAQAAEEQELAQVRAALQERLADEIASAVLRIARQPEVIEQEAAALRRSAEFYQANLPKLLCRQQEAAHSRRESTAALSLRILLDPGFPDSHLALRFARPHDRGSDRIVGMLKSSPKCVRLEFLHKFFLLSGCLRSESDRLSASERLSQIVAPGALVREALLYIRGLSFWKVHQRSHIQETAEARQGLKMLLLTVAEQQSGLLGCGQLLRLFRGGEWDVCEKSLQLIFRDYAEELGERLQKMLRDGPDCYPWVKQLIHGATRLPDSAQAVGFLLGLMHCGNLWGACAAGSRLLSDERLSAEAAVQLQQVIQEQRRQGRASPEFTALCVLARDHEAAHELVCELLAEEREWSVADFETMTGLEQRTLPHCQPETTGDDSPIAMEWNLSHLVRHGITLPTLLFWVDNEQVKARTAGNLLQAAYQDDPQEMLVAVRQLLAENISSARLLRRLIGLEDLPQSSFDRVLE